MEKEGYVQWKQGQVPWEEFRDVTCQCREKICAAKAQLQMKLARTAEGQKKRSYLKYVNDRRQLQPIAG